jgi:DNA invertase Pin-like site-specific DNA recombinase
MNKKLNEFDVHDTTFKTALELLNENKKIKVAIYTRVSTFSQELENQLLQLREYAEKSKWDIYKEYSEVISGKEDKRTQFDSLFKDAHMKLFDGVLFWSLDRFSRSGTLFTLQKLRELDNLNIFWHSYQDAYISTAGEWKDLIISIMSTLSKIEQQRISQRTKSGLKRTTKRIGRPAIPEEKIKIVVRLLEKGYSYPEIKKIVKYRTKQGKLRHISLGKISDIKKSISKKEGASSA